MSSVIICPGCQRKLIAPETMRGQSFGCPGCKAILPPESLVPLAEEDIEIAELEAPTPVRSIQKEPSSVAVRLIIGVAAGCAVLMLLVLGAGSGLVWYYFRAKTVPAAEWQMFSPPDSGCTVQMPGLPFTQSLDMMGRIASNYQVERQRESAVFSVLVFDLPPQAVRASVLDELAQGSLHRQLAQMEAGSQLVSNTIISLGNIRGRECQIKLPSQGMFIERMYLARIGDAHRIYVVRAGGYYLQPNAGDAAHFFDSFQLDASAAPPSFGEQRP